MSQKIFSSTLSSAVDAQEAIDELTRQIGEDLGGKSCDLAILFISETYEDLDGKAIVKKFCEAVNPKYLIGCNASGVVGGETEIEMKPAMAAMAMHLPDVQITPFHLEQDEVDMLKSGEDLIKTLDIYPTDTPKFFCLADPVTCDVTRFVELFNEGYPNSPIIGGLASGIVVGVDNWMTLNGEILPGGVIGLALNGKIDLDIVVSQGCKPIGEPLIITKADRNVLYELAGKPVLEVLNDVYNQLPAEDKSIAKHSIFVGIVMNESRPHFRRGDFLIRNIMGVDHEKGAIAVGDMIAPGQTFQFQLRDARAAADDLKAVLQRSIRDKTNTCEGALLVTCCGRGQALFREPDHDVKLIQAERGPMPLIGFFANGEFGRIDKKNYIHGYTSSLTIIR